MSRAPRRSRAQWRKLYDRWRQSGQPAAAFAREQGVNPRTFAWWRSELGRENALSLVRVRTEPVPEIQESGQEPIEVVLPDGLLIRVPEQAAPERVSALVAALRGS